ncbi:MAG: MFS transporter [Verrucomicrobiota bacterium]|jgi:nucleoside transporter
MNITIRSKLFLMMALEFAIWGCWLPLIYNYLPALGFSPGQQAWVLNAFPIAAVIGMFFSNQFADRNFAAEKFLAFSHLVGGLALLLLTFTKSFWPFLGLMFVHCLLYVPTLSIVNSIAFAHLKDPQKEYGLVRVGSSVGWVLASWPFAFILVDWNKVHAANPAGVVNWLSTVLGSGLTGEALQHGSRWIFLVAGLASLVLAAYSLALPHTPPKKAEQGVDRFAWLEAIKLLRQPFVLVLWLVSATVAFVLYAYFQWTNIFLVTPAAAGGVGIAGNWAMPIMSIGQVAEIFANLILGLALKRLGWRTTMLVGILAHIGRFAVYAFWPAPAPIILVQLLHGFCYAFFFSTVYIFVDEYFPKDVRASAQGLFNVVILGLGNLVANFVCPPLIQRVFKQNGVVDFHGLFLVPLAIATLAGIALALFFRPPAKKEPAPSTETALAA